MKLYFHVDRTQRLKPGDIVEKAPFYDNTPVKIFTPFMDTDFINHVQCMCRNGLSNHGVSYILNMLTANTASLFTEIYFEYIRYKYYSNCPSRFQSFFAFRDYKDAFNFGKGHGSGIIYEVKCTGNYFIGDMNVLKLDCDVARQENYARMYWESKPLLTELDYKPVWECVINLPVEIIREAVVNPLEI